MGWEQGAEGVDIENGSIYAPHTYNCPFFLILPFYLLQHIFTINHRSYLSTPEVLRLSATCLEMQRIFKTTVEKNFTFRYVLGMELELWVLIHVRVAEKNKHKYYTPQRIKIENKKGFRTNFPSLIRFPSLTHLTIGKGINFSVDSLPSSLTFLSLGHSFNHPLDHLPPSLTHLFIGISFTHPLDHLPPSLTHLEFTERHDLEDIGTSKFDCPVDHLPPSLANLSLGSSFNHPLDHLPSSLIYLSTGSDFIFPVDYLPPFLTSLKLIRTIKYPLQHFNYLLPLVFHDQFTKLYFDLVSDERSSYNHPLDNLPPSLTSLSFAKCNFPLHHLPASLTSLSISPFNVMPLAYLPVALTELTLGNTFNSPLNFLPSSLTRIKLGETFDQNIDHFPSSLLSITLGVEFNQPITHFPPFLQSITFGTRFNHPITHLPSSLLSITFGSDFNSPIDHLPHSLTQLTFFSRDKYSLRQFVTLMPPALTHLTAMVNELGDIDICLHLPPLLTHLTLQSAVHQPFHNLPSSLRQLVLWGPSSSNTFIQASTLPPLLTHLAVLTALPQQLPSTLTHLIIGPKYVDAFPPLPPSITHITFMGRFSFPPSLSSLPLLSRVTHQFHYFNCRIYTPPSMNINFNQELILH